MLRKLFTPCFILQTFVLLTYGKDLLPSVITKNSNISVLEDTSTANIKVTDEISHPNKGINVPEAHNNSTALDLMPDLTHIERETSSKPDNASLIDLTHNGRENVKNTYVTKTNNTKIFPDITTENVPTPELGISMNEIPKYDVFSEKNDGKSIVPKKGVIYEENDETTSMQGIQHVNNSSSTTTKSRINGSNTIKLGLKPSEKTKIVKDDIDLDSKLMLPIIAIVFSIPLVGLMFVGFYKCGKEWWQHRHYRRMDFLIDGMYNN